MKQPPRDLCICADDFGLSEGINMAALLLADLGKISAIGCMVRRGAWAAGARDARGLNPVDLDLGLHLDLSFPDRHGHPERGLAGLIARSYLGLLRAGPLRREIRAQFGRFEDAIGRAPAFVDGHRHVHQLPGVRDLLVDEIARRYSLEKPWLRNTAPPRAARGHGKADLIHALGGGALARLASSRGLPMSRALLGVYDFSGPPDYRDRLALWQAQCESGDVLMCHPSTGDTEQVPHGPARLREYAALRDFDWSCGSGAAALRIVPLSHSFGTQLDRIGQ
ncbi:MULTISPECIES: ChbG/HpnK family deacetylase [unclassified Variovorax]|uniref:ChbG/HpnK family deacetylase n=1 Tax=unclassified Variovorax TaxID=663243 RepID=UPI0025760261|nr:MULTISPECIES: ChbG/HpnK family deacetylase [unclassified Variovorax]MDM0086334.1 ChbG/HpnK family deacetylase [Variovorax sp. J22G40]MDM0145409.1 ChbG/HpnK family deacetylase [Variovorax sp. J2P1-31]